MSRKIENALKRSGLSGLGRNGGTLLAAAGCLALSCAVLPAQTNTGSTVDQELEQMRLMRIRSEAQKSRPDAQAAQIQNAATEAQLNQQNQKALNEARAIREAKERAVRDAKLRQADNAYQGVSSNQIQTWSDQSTGGVKVQRNVPLEVQSELNAQEAQRRKLEGDPNEKKGLFRAPGRALKGALGWGGDEESPPASQIEPERERDGFLSRLPGMKKEKEESAGVASAPAEEKDGLLHRMGEKLPFGRKKEEEAAPAAMPAFAPVNSINSRNAAPTPVSMTQTAAVEPPEPERQGFLNRVGGSLPLIGRGRKEEPVDPGTFGPNNPSPVMAAAPESLPDSQEKKGLFGRKKQDDMAGSSLFPTSGDSAVLAQGNTQSGSGGGGGIGRFVPKLPKIGEMSLPKLGGDSTPVVDNSPAPDPKLKGVTKSTTHSGGSDLYVVKQQTQFMQFGASALSSESITLSPGTVVRMTKPGDDWCSVQLSSGAEGVVQNGALKAASAGETAGVSFSPVSRSSSMAQAPATRSSGSFVGPASAPAVKRDVAPLPTAAMTTPPVASSRPARISSTVSAAQNEAEAGNSLPAIGIPASTDPLSSLPGTAPAPVPAATGQESLALP